MEHKNVTSEKRMLLRADIKKRWGIGDKVLNRLLEVGVLVPAIQHPGLVLFSIVDIERVEARKKERHDQYD